MSKHPTHTTSSSTNHKSSEQSTSTNLTKPEVKEVVAETVEQLVTTSQEKPAVAPEAAPLPKYDAEYIKTLNVSGAVRYLFGLGFTRGQIVKEFPKAKGRTILYQHVRNVLITPVKASS